MKGSVVTQVLNANFQNLLNRIDELEAENENLKKTAMIGNNGNGGVTEDAVVNVIFNPQTIMAKTTEKDVHYTVDVQVMCGNQELLLLIGIERLIRVALSVMSRRKTVRNYLLMSM